MKWNKNSIMGIITGLIAILDIYSIVDLVVNWNRGNLLDWAVSEFNMALRVYGLIFAISIMLTISFYDKYKRGEK